MELICPVCGSPLKQQEKAYACPNRHLFDRAKSGYVNLLLSDAKHAKAPGDNKEMVRARRQFLNAGYYQCLADAVAEETQKIAADADWKSPVVLDAGCGEGYYTSSVYHALRPAVSPQMFGVDISKFALQEAAKRGRGIAYAVASIFHLPVAGQSCDLLFNLFAPYCHEEFYRVLKPDGVLLMVIPGKYHLWELKQKLYDTPYPNEPKDYALDGYTFCGKREVKGQIAVEGQEMIQALFQMTPYYYKTAQADADKIALLTSLETRIEFELLIYRKRPL